MKLTLNEAYHPIDLSIIKCSHCGSTGNWKSKLIHSKEFDLNCYELTCLDCQNIQYRDEWEHKSIPCPDCGIEMIVTPYPGKKVDEFTAFCVICSNNK